MEPYSTRVDKSLRSRSRSPLNDSNPFGYPSDASDISTIQSLREEKEAPIQLIEITEEGHCKPNPRALDVIRSI
jgi:hypothetical protein